MPFVSTLTPFPPNLGNCGAPPIFSALSFHLTSFFSRFFVNLSVAAPLATPSCEGLLLQDNAVSAEIRALLSSYYNDR